MSTAHDPTTAQDTASAQMTPSDNTLCLDLDNAVDLAVWPPKMRSTLVFSSSELNRKLSEEAMMTAEMAKIAKK